jgi:hypothetical protein
LTVLRTRRSLAHDAATLGRIVDGLAERLADRLSRKILSQYYFRELHPATLLQREVQEEAAA